ncbi:MAG: DUF2239 family protein [Chloroflexota bacterium]
MVNAFSNACTSFDGHQRIASGPLHEVALVVKRAIETGAVDSILTFDDATGRVIDIDISGSDEEVVARLAKPAATDNDSEAAQLELSAVPESNDTDAKVTKPRDRGRPKLGVVAREVTLLPRHWEWLATQPGGASVALRKLVEEARRTNNSKDRLRHAQERAYRFMSAIAGNMENFEEATRALFANDQPRCSELVAVWPDDVRNYAITLAFGDDNHAS